MVLKLLNKVSKKLTAIKENKSLRVKKYQQKYKKNKIPQVKKYLEAKQKKISAPAL